jgi:hypothetical protein
MMARSDLLVSLVRAAATGDREALKSTAEALAADERAKKHHILADRLQRALSAVPVTPPPLTTSVGAGTASGREAIIEIEPRIRLDDLLLPLPVRENGRQLVEEHVRADVLRANGWTGLGAPTVQPNMSIALTVQRDPDQGAIIDEPIPFGLAVTLTMPGVVEIYDQLRHRLRWGACSRCARQNVRLSRRQTAARARIFSRCRRGGTRAGHALRAA